MIKYLSPRSKGQIYYNHLKDGYKRMGKLIEAIIIAVGVALLIGVAAVLGGTVIWIIWPYALPVVFPKAVTAGIIVAKLPWVNAVCLTWLCGILLKSSQTNNNKDK